eukprot:scaffold18708_cov30-Phaeocystis_antarctica.AAC.1
MAGVLKVVRLGMLWKLHSTKDEDLLTPQWAREMTVTRPYFFYTGTDAPFRPSHTSQRSATSAVAAKIMAGARAAMAVTAAAAAGLGNRRWRRW